MPRRDAADVHDAVRRLASRIQHDPVWAARHILGAELEDYQCRVLESVRDFDVTPVKSCNGIGKTFVSAVAVPLFLLAHPPLPENDFTGSIVVTTAPTHRQVRDNLWQEVRRLAENARVPLAKSLPNTQSWEIAPKWFATGFAAPDYNATKFQGLHAPHILVIGDEACGLSREIFVGIEALMTSEGARLLLPGNPTDGMSPFAAYFKGHDARVNPITVPAWATPNFTAFGVAADDLRTGAWEDKVGGRPMPRPHLITPRWAAMMVAKYGWDSPQVRARVRAEFPESGDGLVIVHTPWLVRAAERRVALGDAATGPTVLGADLGFGGEDPTVVYRRRGSAIDLLIEQHGLDTEGNVGMLKRLKREHGAVEVFFDATGPGIGVRDLLRGEDGFVPVNFGEAAYQKDEFENARCELYFALARALETDKVDFNDAELAAQLQETKRRPDRKGRWALIPKEDIAKALGRSPDHADAAVLTMVRDARPRVFLI